MSEDTQSTDEDDADESRRAQWSSVGDLTTSLLEAVADETGEDVTDLPPLNDAIDPDALESLLTRDPSDSIQLAFSYTGVRVRIDSDGYLFVQQRTGTER
ncbi:hypothetical protein EGH21_16810 [Halomicroarcula sp. F13]|uniref:Halobacterial output domain-containing protein n=1 Tax=Haloarcula rubra TaxID=2487747 RepID=A0AAW4PX43_9EURY|nr:HalOD1 output domain-containing protein [Halomicroarcula rubra]MBX0324689.1 hypothetical protein [Halomicroarcula rubra]